MSAGATGAASQNGIDVSELWKYPGVRGISVAPDKKTITVWISEARYADKLPDTFKGLVLVVHVSGTPKVQAPDESGRLHYG
jgi:hypothetical protein